MIEKIIEYIKQNDINIYDVAVMTEKGIEYAKVQPCGKCHASYSVAKLFIVTAVGILYDEGKIRLDDRLTDILRGDLRFDYDPVWDAVTVRHALTHSMGIDYGVTDIDRDDVSQYGENYLKYIFSYPPKYKPGEHRQYTDVPHYLLSLAIEKVTGKRADEFITEKILTPLSFDAVAWSRCPMGHTIGASGAYMSARDMVKIAWLYQNYGEYQGKRIVSKEWVTLAEDGDFDLRTLQNTSFVGKGGLNGQMTMFCRKRRLCAAWHGFVTDKRDKILIPWLEELIL